MGLKDYIIKRCLLFFPLVLGLTVITFSITRLAPGDPVDFYLSKTEVFDPEIIQRLRSEMHLDEPIWIQYFTWLRGVLSLNMGYSFLTREPVGKLMIIAIGNTARLAFTSLLLSVIISIPIGVISAVRQGSKIDNILRPVVLFGISMPGFWMGLLLILTFSVALGWFPTSGIRSIGSSSFLDELAHMVLPVAVLTTKLSALITRLTRSGMLNELSKEYVVTARSKGLRERVVVYKHALRNALLPVVTSIGLSIGTLLNGSVLVETVFAWPGIGRLLVESAYARDYPVLMATTLMAGFLVSVVNLITDISYAYLDPRIKY